MIYTDPLFSCVPSSAWRWPEASHLFADDVADLHAFAEKLGLRREWFQNRPDRLPHYDLHASKHRLALRRGARLLSRRETAAKIKELRERPGGFFASAPLAETLPLFPLLDSTATEFCPCPTTPQTKPPH